jgi:hypothetical protein
VEFVGENADFSKEENPAKRRAIQSALEVVASYVSMASVDNESAEMKNRKAPRLPTRCKRSAFP